VKDIKLHVEISDDFHSEEVCPILYLLVADSRQVGDDVVLARETDDEGYLRDGHKTSALIILIELEAISLLAPRIA
jgi:hypothetical protein